MKSKLDKLDVGKLLPVVDLSRLSNVAKNDVIKKDVYNVTTKTILNLKIMRWKVKYLVLLYLVLQLSCSYYCWK